MKTSHETEHKNVENQIGFKKETTKDTVMNEARRIKRERETRRQQNQTTHVS